MANWADLLDVESRVRLRQLAHDLRSRRYRGWSVTVSDENEIVVRPEDRSVGKFSITCSQGEWQLAFFSRPLNQWSLYLDLPDSPDVAVTLFQKMEEEVSPAPAG